MNRPMRATVPGWLVIAFVLLTVPAFGQDPNLCDLPGEEPDVIVGDLINVQNYGNAGDYFGYAVGTSSCNIGTCWLKWFSGTNEHPVIGQNMYRIKDGRLDQIGQSWLKHGFFALSQELCSTGCEGTDGTHLGVNCSDPYVASLNGSQGNLGPRYEVNPYTGVYPYPFATIGETGDESFKRIRVHRDDLDPALNAGATYFVEGQYVTQDDAAAGNGLNNNSWRLINVDPASYNISLTGATNRSQSAVRGWRTLQSTVIMAFLNVPDEGQFHLGADTFLNPDGTRRFVYAIQNINSDRAARAFSIPVPQGANVMNIGFNDTDSHSGDPHDTTDWDAYYDYANSRIVWETATFAENEFANALRWGTTYSFWFDIVETPWTLTNVDVELFKPGPVPGEFTVTSPSPVYVPVACDDDGTCEPGETCTNCPNDCTGLGPPTGFCGDGLCDLGLGEDCTNCSDCNGVQTGPQADRYCCGAGGGDNPLPCTDPLCTAGGMTCGTSEEPYCCGDGVCDSGESLCSCPDDCGPVPATEGTCNDGEDNDCDGLVDCGDLDCCADGVCATGADNDNDGVADCDCDDNDASVWGRPSPTSDLTVNDTAGATLNWSPPTSPGADSVGYETLRVGAAEAFKYISTCVVDADPFDLSVSDGDDPAPGYVFHYLVRATNGCPGETSNGSLGQSSAGGDREAPSCP